MSLFAAEHETIAGVARALRSGETTCRQVLDKCLDRIVEWEGRVKAWVRVDREGAIEQAEVLDRELSDGVSRGPLHGVPFGIKDIIDVKGLPTAAGFKPWRDRIAEEDAPVVASLRAAGAVILGKTVTTQFAWIDPPPTRNPWDLNRTPGGSSSGSAAAVALGMCLGAVGTQTGGSIVRPASFCGVAGYMGLRGHPESTGVVPLSTRLDHVGALARTTHDLRLIARHGFGDRDVWPQKGDDRSPPNRVSPKLLRPRSFFERRAEPAALDAFERTLESLEKAGAGIVECDDDVFDFERLLTLHRTIMASEAAAEHEARFSANPDDFSTHIRGLVEEGLRIPAPRYILACNDLDQSKSKYQYDFEPGIDAIVTPAAVGPAPDIATTGNPCFNSIWSALDFPTLTFPMALSPERLPLGLQLTGVPSPGVAFELFDAADWCENVIRHAPRAEGF